ncbi:MAG: hypothetical protein HOO86_03930 [Bacteroidales bacterium]|nr:hypothetical protein [Bacteroidales bacterium]
MKIAQKVTIQNQINRLINLGFPKLLNVTDQEYLNSFSIVGEPSFDEYKNLFDIPVIVDPRIPFEKLISTVGIDNYLNISDIKHFSTDMFRPYIFYTHDSKRYASHTAATAIHEFEPDEEGCTLQELIFFYLHFPHLFEGIAMDAILTDFRQADYHPCLLKVTEKTEIGAHWHHDLTAGINILSKGKRLFMFNLA